MDKRIEMVGLVVAGVVLAGLLMNSLRGNIDLIRQASNGFDTGYL